MKTEKFSDKTELEFKICLRCGHLQNVQIGTCDKCEAGKIGLGKPPELWAYLTLKIEGVLRLPENYKPLLTHGLTQGEQEVLE